MAFKKLHTCATNTYIIKKGMGCGFRWVGVGGSPDLDAKFLEKNPVNQHLHKSIQVCKMHHNKGKLHDAAFEILLMWYMRL
jgi:hypothetical protein